MSRKRLAGLLAILVAIGLLLTRGGILRSAKHAAEPGTTSNPGLAGSPKIQASVTQNGVRPASVDPFAAPGSASRTAPVAAAASPGPGASSEAIVARDAAGWKTYTSSEYGFEIRYPTGWLFNDDYENNYGRPPSGKRAAGYAGELRNLFSLEKEGADQPHEGGGDFEDGAVVEVKITGTKGVVESWTLTTTRPWYLVTSTPEEWVKLQSTLFGGNHVDHVTVATNEFTGMVEAARDDSNPDKIWGESGGAYRVLPDGRVLLVSWERMNIANDLSYQAYFLPMLSSFKPLR